MKPNASSPHRLQYSGLLDQPALWAGLFILLMLGIICFPVFAAANQTSRQELTSARHYAQLLSICQQSHAESLTEREIAECLGSFQDTASGQIIILDADGSILMVGGQQIGSISLQARYDFVMPERTFLRRPPGFASAMLIASANIPGTDRLLVLQQPIPELLADNAGLVILSLMPALFALALAGLAYFLIKHKILRPLRQVVLQAQRIAGGDTDEVQVTKSGVPEIMELNTALTEALRVIKLSRLNAQDYVSQIAEVQEAERKRFSHELHDETMQGLVAIGQRLQLAQRAIEHDDKTGIVTRVEQARELNQLVMDSLRRTIRALRPMTLEDAGLLSALEALAEETRSPDLRTSLHIEGEPRMLSKETELAVFRVAQEALTNVRKHARASQVTMLIQFAKTQLVIEVIDDGVGFEPQQPGDENGHDGHYGLVGMQERIFATGGRLTIESVKGHGTTVKARIPYNGTAAPHLKDDVP